MMSKIKGLFNWRLHDKNLDIKERNYKTLMSSMKSLFFFILILIPVFIFSYIVYNNPNLKTYINYDPSQHLGNGEENLGNHIWNYLDIPNGNTIYSFLWIGYAFIFVSIICIFLFKPIATGKGSREFKLAYTNSIIVIEIIAILMVSLSQYQYSKFFEFYRYEAITTGMKESLANASIKFSWADAISKEFTNLLGKGDVLKSWNWEQSAVVWWVMFFQIMIVFAFILSLQNSMFGKVYVENEYKAYVDLNGNNEITSSKFNKALRGWFLNNDRNIARYMIICSLIIIIPGLVFSILTTIDGTNINSVISWSYKAPVLLGDINPKAVENIQATTSSIDGSDVFKVLEHLKSPQYGQLFSTVSLQLIVIGITIATLFFMFIVLIRGKNVSNKIFMYESIVLAIELLIVVSVLIQSKIYIYRLTDFWNDNKGFFDSLSNILGQKDYEGITTMFNVGGLENTFKIEWASHSGVIAEGIISYAFVIGSFSIIGFNLYKLTYGENHKLFSKKLKQ